MKKLILTSILLIGIVSSKGQISITSDSLVICKSDAMMEKYIPVNRQAESLSLEIDKDLLTLRIFGTDHEHALIEKGYMLELLQVDNNKEKWLFRGEDINCISYTITLDVIKKRLDLITTRVEPNGNKALSMIYYPIVGIKINKEAIDKHLKEKGTNKF